MPKILSNEEMLKNGFTTKNGEKPRPLFSAEIASNKILASVAEIIDKAQSIESKSLSTEASVVGYIKSVGEKISKEIDAQYTLIENQLNYLRDRLELIKMKNNARYVEFDIIRDSQGRLKKIIATEVENG